MSHTAFNSRTRSRLALLIAGMLIVPSVQAGGMKKKMKDAQGAFVIAPGISFLDLEELNDEWAIRDIPEFETFSPTLNVSKNFYAGRMVSTGELNFMFWESRYAHGVETGLFGFSVMSHWGFNVLSSHLDARIYPLLGLGYGVLKLDINDHKRSFSSAFASDGYSVKLLQHTFLIALSGAAEYLLPIWHGKKLTLGLRGGYVFDVIEHDRWLQKQGTEVTGGPEISMSGGYIAVIIGKSIDYPLHKKMHDK
ncbi:MAG: hypothetical protein GF398_19085 [Chitinivibrionales bacterium]|nr:hypothetical protein [Chitinivibrionales bacterium]